MCARENHAQYACRPAETGTGGRVMAAVAHCTAVATSLPADRAWKAPCAAAWHALAGAPPRLAHANHSAYERSSGVGTNFAGSTFRFWSTTPHDDFVPDGAGWVGGGGGGGGGAAGMGLAAGGGAGP